MKYRIKKIQGNWHIQVWLGNVLYNGEHEEVWGTVYSATSWGECLAAVCEADGYGYG